MIRRPPRSTPKPSSAASDVYKRQSQAVAGGSLGSEEVQVVYPIPRDPETWPMCFYVGGPVIRDDETGQITLVQVADVAEERRADLKKIILQGKPLHAWGVMVINYT